MTSVRVVTIAAEDPRGEDVRTLVAALDADMTGLYRPDACHLRPVEALAEPDTFFLVAREKARAVGCGALAPLADGAGEIKRMWVEPDARGHRIARQILDMLVREAGERGYGAVRLQVGDRQPAALALYRACGFVERGPFGEYAEHPNLIFMELSLASGSDVS